MLQCVGEFSNKVSQRDRYTEPVWHADHLQNHHVCRHNGGGQNAKMSMEQDLWESQESKRKAQRNRDSVA